MFSKVVCCRCVCNWERVKQIVVQVKWFPMSNIYSRRQWCSGNASTSGTKGPGFKSCDELILSIEISHK